MPAWASPRLMYSRPSRAEAANLKAGMCAASSSILEPLLHLATLDPLDAAFVHPGGLGHALIVDTARTHRIQDGVEVAGTGATRPPLDGTTV